MAEPFCEQEDDGETVLSVIIADGPTDRIDKALARSVPEEASLSRTRLMRMIAQGAVLIAGQAVTDPKTKVSAGDAVLLILEPPTDVETLAEDIPLTVMYEDDDLIVIDKPAGMVVHPAPGTPNGTLVNALLAHCGETLSGIGGERRPGIVHRIDKETTGLLVVAKSDKAHHGLAAQFEKHTVNRRYLALVHAVPNAADPRLRGVKGVTFETGGIIRIATLLARHKTDRQRQAVVWHDGRHAVTRVRVLEAFADQAALVECWLETGRTHQIRVHMTYAGHSLLGDQTYGGKRKLSPKAVGEGPAALGNGFARQALHAATLGFTHPVSGEWLEFTSQLPEDMAHLLAALRAGKEAPAE
ncbi:MAG: RluA family pseudouridine synthase [Rhodobacteraceae bacterium]|jgi:23S rRNA pseudouridine1911/1915/1917 synthase|nr:RluA family pseudouridine synthase [Paracoccaceae bacterium]MCF8514552.1 RluA family pseudouridine synthase [Paracoccaceae bacterium]MCF8518907.1 RluA family pseudouridine synthase [Paracoccaceae bacterium]